MVDPKRLIKSMELCMGAERDCHKCMYCETENDCRDSMIYDAVELLKKQEAVEAKSMVSSKEYGSWWFACGACGHAIDLEDNYCRECGKAVKWND